MKSPMASVFYQSLRTLTYYAPALDYTYYLYKYYILPSLLHFLIKKEQHILYNKYIVLNHEHKKQHLPTHKYEIK